MGDRGPDVDRHVTEGDPDRVEEPVRTVCDVGLFGLATMTVGDVGRIGSARSAIRIRDMRTSVRSQEGNPVERHRRRLAQTIEL